ncbi:MAG: DUF2079 domain-containing protein [Caldilineaceae bacterium]|nr:DUF2079 domain-containing protein [Caldilineaceae bacterium]
MTPRKFRLSIAKFIFDPYRLLLLLAVLLYVGIFADLAFDQHAGMRTHKADLGQMDQAIWNTSRGRFVEATENDIQSTRLTDHVEPIFALISPIFWIWDDARALLLLQVVAVAIGAFPLYALALEKLNQLLSPVDRTKIWLRDPVEQLTRPLALALAVAYLLAPQLQAAVLTEFHAIPLAVPLILWAFWAVEFRRWGQFAVAALLVASVKEEAALLGAGLGVWALWRIAGSNSSIPRGCFGQKETEQFLSSRWQVAGSRPQTTDPQSPIPNPQSLALAASVTILSLIWFYVATFMIVPAHAVEFYEVAESNYFRRYGALGDSPGDIVRSFFTQPGLVWQIATEPARIDYVWGLLALFGFLSLLAPEILLLCLPLLLANQLSAYPAQYYGEFHYSAPLIPYVGVAAAYGLGRLWRTLARRVNRRSASFQHLPAASAPTMALVSLFTNAQTALRPLLAWGCVLWLLIWAGWRYADAGFGPWGGRYDPTPITEHHRLLPRFTAQIPRGAAVSATAAVHPHLSHRRYIYQFPWGIEPAEKADWALLDVTTNTDMAPGDLKAVVDRMLARDWGIVDAEDGFLLLRRGAGSKEIPDAFYSFARESGTGDWGLGIGDRGLGTGDWGLGAESPLTIRPSQFAIRNSISFGPLTFLGVELEDWPRWRQTKVTTIWRVGDGYVPGSLRPWLELRTPGGDPLYNYAEISPPALVWYPSDRWQRGEIIRIQTLWLFLPRSWGAAVGVVHGPDPSAPADRLPVGEIVDGQIDESGTLALVAAFSRHADDSLAALPVGSFALSAAIPLAARVGDVHGYWGMDRQAMVTAWLPRRATAGHPLDLWLHWQQTDPLAFERYMPFVHLRRDGETLAQADGWPRFFVSLPRSAADLSDWRQLWLPADLPSGEVEVYIGLFDPITGERLDAFDAGGRPVGNELLLGRVRVDPPLVPDQACALIPPACASQPE